MAVWVWSRAENTMTVVDDVETSADKSSTSRTKAESKRTKRSVNPATTESLEDK